MIWICSKIPSLAEQSQLGASLGSNNGGGARPSVVRSGKRDVFDVVVVEADEKDWYLNGMMTAAEANGSHH